MTWERQQAYAFENGKIEGIYVGKEEKAKETAKNLLNMKVLTYEQIAQVTGLSVEDIQEIAEKELVTEK